MLLDRGLIARNLTATTFHKKVRGGVASNGFRRLKNLSRGRVLRLW
jgi:hypothetical protein